MRYEIIAHVSRTPYELFSLIAAYAVFKQSRDKPLTYELSE
jgi:hypothetical protein